MEQDEAMDPFTMIVAIVALGCGTRVICTFLGTTRSRAGKRSRKEEQALLREMQALREEIRQLRHQNNDTILNLDTTIQRVEHRLTHMEARERLEAGDGSAAMETAVQVAGQRR